MTNEEAKNWCRQNGDMRYVQTSAKNNVGCEEAFDVLIKQALKHDSTSKLNLPEHIKITREDRNGNKDSKNTSGSKNSKKKKKG